MATDQPPDTEEYDLRAPMFNLGMIGVRENRRDEGRTFTVAFLRWVSVVERSTGAILRTEPCNVRIIHHD